MEIVSTLVGGFLAAGTGWFLQSRAEASRVKRGKRVFTTGVLDDLRAAVELFDRLKEDWDRDKTVWFTTINELLESRHAYIQHRDWLLTFEDDVLRKAIVTYYTKSANHLIDMRNAQQRLYDLHSQIAQAAVEVRAAMPDATNEQHIEAITQRLPTAEAETQFLGSRLPELVIGLERFKGEARELIRKLESGPIL